MMNEVMKVMKILTFLFLVVLTVNTIVIIFVHPIGHFGFAVAGIAIWAVAAMVWLKSV